MRDSMVMLEMAARVLSKFMGRDYSRRLPRDGPMPKDYLLSVCIGKARASTFLNFELPPPKNIAIIAGCTEFCYADTNVWQAVVWLTWFGRRTERTCLANNNVCKRT